MFSDPPLPPLIWVHPQAIFVNDMRYLLDLFDLEILGRPVLFARRELSTKAAAVLSVSERLLLVGNSHRP
jgi:hypothetical protein